MGEKIGIYIDGKLMAEAISCQLPVMLDKQSPGWEDLKEWEISGAYATSVTGEPSECKAEYYLRRGNSFYFRNENGIAKLTVRGRKLKELESLGMKYGNIVNMKFGYK